MTPELIINQQGYLAALLPGTPQGIFGPVQGSIVPHVRGKVPDQQHHFWPEGVW